MDDATPRSDDAPEATEVDLAQLQAENEALKAQVSELASKKGRWGRRTRKAIAVVLVVVFALSFVASGVGIWLQRNTLNRDVWSERVIPLGEDPEVQEALARYTTAQLMATVDPQKLIADALPERAQVLAVPLSSAVEQFVADRVEQFFTSDRFEELWTFAATKAHEEAVKTLRGEDPAVVADDEKITINLIPIIDAVLSEILDVAPGLVGSDVQLPDIKLEDVPEQARERLATALGVELDDDFGTITVYDEGKLSAAQTAVRWLDALVIPMSLFAVATFVAALWVSLRRRRTLFQLLGAAAVGSIAIRRICFLLQDEVSGLVKVDENRAAVDTVVATFIDPLTGAAGGVLWIIGLTAFVAAITGPYRWAVALRSAVVGTASSLGDRARDPETAEWIVAHADVLRVVGYVLGALLLWFVTLTWLTFLLVVAFVVAWQVVLNRLAPSEPDEEEPVDGEGDDSAESPAEGEAVDATASQD